MRKINNILVHIIIALFLLHALMGSLILLGVSRISFRILSYTLLMVVFMHAVISMVSTLRALESGQKSKKWYLRKNTGFWTKRISGLSILVLLIFHMTAYTRSNGTMIAQLLFILAIFVHLAVSVKSMLIARGTIHLKDRLIDCMFVLSAMILFFSLAIITYYIQ